VVALAISGAASMIYEVAWTRALSLVIGSSTYAFTAMLLAFLVGIAGGAALYAWRWGRRRATRAAFATLQIAAAAAAAVVRAHAGLFSSPRVRCPALRPAVQLAVARPRSCRRPC
jgi:hypothetical protein